jgi:hypothetical protein
MHGVTMKNYKVKPIVKSVSFHILKFISLIERPWDTIVNWILAGIHTMF